MHVAFLPRHATSWVKMLDLAAVLKRDGSFSPLVLLTVEALAGRRAECEAAGIECMDLVEDLKACKIADGWIATAIRSAADWFKRHDKLSASLLGGILQSITLRRQLRAEYDVFQNLFQTIAPCALLAPGDRELSPVPPALKAARDLGVPVVVAAFSSPYTEGLVQARQHLHRFQLAISKWPPLLNLLARFMLPHQAIATARGAILFSPGWLTLTLAAEEMLSENPWIQGAGNSDFHLQHSYQRMADFIRLGAPSERMVMVGDVALDSLYRHFESRTGLRRSLDAQYGFMPDAPLAVFAVPNDAEHDVCSWDEHLERMDAFFKVLPSKSTNIVLSLHPKSPPERYAPLAGKYGLIIGQQRLYDILPAADLYICSGSSTVLWAQLCGIPVLNLDYLNIRDADFVSVSGIVNVVTPGELFSVLEQWRAGKNPFGDVLKRSTELRKDCLFDGRSGARILDFLNTISSGVKQVTLDGKRKSAA
ncbi:MAG: hypothetical protein VW600_04090 [Ferrovibrio sp.]